MKKAKYNIWIVPPHAWTPIPCPKYKAQGTTMDTFSIDPNFGRCKEEWGAFLKHLAKQK